MVSEKIDVQERSDSNAGRLQAEGAGKEVSPDRPFTLAHLLMMQALKNPSHPAILQGQEQLNYDQLWRRVSACAKALRRRGVGKGDRVVVLMGNSSDYVSCYYALSAIGAVAIPLNTALKGQQLANIISHAEPALIVHDGKQPQLCSLVSGSEEPSDQGPGDLRERAVPSFAACAASIAELLADAELLAENESLSFEELASPVSKQDLAAIVYTSGTTGRPKGVMLSVGNLVSNTQAIVHYLGLSHRDSVVCVLPFYYAYGSSVLHSHLAAGASLVVENSLMYPQKILEAMETLQVTGFSGVPSTYRLLLQRCDLSRHPLAALRYVTQAGGALSVEDIREVRRCWPSAQFYVMYGQTEATARLTYLPPERLDEKVGSVGIPIPGVRIRILDDNGREKPRGEAGEICASGPGTMLGYWRDPQATQGRFFGEWLRTGDLGVQDEDGFVTVVGRRSDMIKTGDHRVAPEEVEQVIASMDGVQDVAVVGVADKLLGQVIHAFVVMAQGCGADQRPILRRCREQCAPYKVPKAIHFVAALPKTASGKVQRFRLLENDTSERCA